ncbi:N-acetylmuramoyl-L-alanine amidase [Rhizobium paknamense]|uniref:N-acetylmuramoyl-L-alanine amidase n=1 Tax=Rhizobium paknamense TaxID=1206817 RepID=A0ABU0I995_9HYPH|nr:N-acetylmuramoyl-L-alanine amidase [Rhizobium paknamense]MDQ0454782.1 N-acetylmuramoyl-L-alanine amidase [Rhizobium paknamense]
MTCFSADFPGATVVPSPNHGERVDGAVPDMIILHYTGMPTEDGALSWLCNPESQVSSHYLVRENGEVVQMVPEARRAWHAGKSFWAGVTDTNSRSIGIEIANAGHPLLPPYPEKQLEAVAQLCRYCADRWQIPPERVLAHSDVAPVRKVDPGEHFPWGWLAQQGIGHWVDPAPIMGGRFFQKGDRGQPIEALQSMLSLYGYPVEITGEFDPATEGVVKSFQLHFRQERVDGVADFSTIDTLHRLLAALPRFA